MIYQTQNIMKNKTILLKKILYIKIILLSFSSIAQEPFNCVYDAYLFQYNDVYSIDLASGNSYLVKEDITQGNINAAAYNPTDGYIWGSLTSPEKTIVRIGKDFSTTTLYINELPTNNRYVGDISSEGVYFLKGGGTTFYKIDLNPNSPTYEKHLETETLSQNINIHDWAFNAVDGNLYAVEKKTNILYRINPRTYEVEALGVVPILSGLNYTYGAVYFDLSGRFYVSANQTGTIYVIQNVQDIKLPTDIESNLFAFGPSSASNDGARCPTAPVPQEICDNGIDDDGDGLVDCQDPSCSGFGVCGVMLAPTSGGNEGGLESNGRLSELINKRNYNRTKVNYKFNRASARKLKKSAKYSKRSKGEIMLESFIPLEVIKEDNVIESTPIDLLAITNATEIYSVDYMKNDVPVASILAMKTENGVYEHSKYICDRLLGAELVSVSTIEIKGKQFIKSLIRNADNTVEFVLSLSAKATNNETHFSIESHWNLDKYEKDITFYNFQIWSNSLDDLYLLADEVINLLEVVKPISAYYLSPAPTVFVRKGKYVNGILDLEIINTNKSDKVTFDSGFRRTETGAFNKASQPLNLEENYITNIKVPTGNLFDIGFRIGDGIATPDDLFMSDGPWGVDDSQENTTIVDYNVFQNKNKFSEDDFPIERNIYLKATTESYFAAYRALTPRFSAVDLSDYNSFNFKARGNGNVEIVLLKKSITSWENQFKTTILLTDELNEFKIPFSEFKSKNGEELLLNDITTITFTMTSDDGNMVVKEMNLQDVYFSKNSKLEVSNFNLQTNQVKVVPNPVKTVSKIYFNSKYEELVNINIYNSMGRIVKTITFEAKIGENIVPFIKGDLKTGIYLCKIIGIKQKYKTVKLLVE